MATLPYKMHRPLPTTFGSMRNFPPAFLRRLTQRQATENYVLKNGEVAFFDCSEQPIAGYSVVLPRNREATLALVSRATPSHFSSIFLSVRLESGAKLNLVCALSGGARLECHTDVVLAGSGAAVTCTGLLHGQQEQHQALHFRCWHFVPRTRGDMMVRGAFGDRARGTISGFIKIAPKAKKTQAFFGSEALLSGQASATSLPTLEIETDDVVASHSATTSPVDKDQVFYLSSRGLPRRRAEQLITRSFFEPALRRLPEPMASQISKLIIPAA